MGGKAIQSVIHVVLRSTCDTVHCLGERARNFNLRLAKTSLWSFFYVFRDNCKFGRPKRSALFVYDRV